MNLTRFVAFVVTLLCYQAIPSWGCLECFVTEKMAKFPSWVLENSLDPTEPINGTLEFSGSNLFLRLEAEIRNLTMQGYSQSVKASQISADLVGGRFRVFTEWIYNITFIGNHTTRGTILSQTPFSGEGHWNLVVSSLDMDSLDIEFEITTTGFLKLTKSYIQRLWFGDILNNLVYFENLSDNEAASGYEEYVNQAMFDGIKRSVEYNADAPIRSTLTKFWEEELAKSTMADIIGSTAWPPDWTTAEATQTSTSTEPETTAGTTQDPCPCAKYSEQSQNQIEVVADDVIETIHEIDENGVPVTYTKRLVVTKQIQEEL